MSHLNLYNRAWMIIVGILLNSLGMNAQCPDGIVHLSSDEEIQEFSKKYPNCTELDSSLIIGPNLDMAKTRITDISPLSNITSIAGDFSLAGNPWLSSIKAIENIEFVGGDYTITIHKDMSEESLKPKLMIVGGEMRVNMSCMNCKAKLLFPELIKVGGSLNLNGYEAMGHMFPSLWKIGGSIWNMASSRKYENNDFPNLRSIGGALYLTMGYVEQEIFQNLNSLKILELSVKGKKRFSVGQLQECADLRIKGTLTNSVGFLSNIDTLQNLSIELLNEKVISSLPNLVHSKKVNINTIEDGYDGSFTNLKSVEEITLYEKAKGSPIRNSTNIKRIELSSIINQSVLSDFKNLQKVERLIYQYGKVSTFIDTIDFELEHLNIYDNKQLTSINLDVSKPLENIIITRNPNLVDIEKLNILPHPNGRLSITQNKNLNNCATPSICNYLKSAPNNVFINSNGPDCTLGKIKEACEID